MLYKIKNLLDKIEKSEQRTAQLLAEAELAYDQLFINARAPVVTGIMKPNFHSFRLQLNAQREAIGTLKFDIEFAIERDPIKPK